MVDIGAMKNDIILFVGMDIGIDKKVDGVDEDLDEWTRHHYSWELHLYMVLPRLFLFDFKPCRLSINKIA